MRDNFIYIINKYFDLRGHVSVVIVAWKNGMTSIDVN